ncbi:hypothetical protein VH86_21435 [Pantoea sp. BL1]|nr:hypothetical protein VH86_21435 [Pantoea sp. BL1]
MSITERIAVGFGRLRSLLSKKEKIMSDQTVIENSASADASTLSPLESFANEVAGKAESSASAADGLTSAVSNAPGQDAIAPVLSSVPATDASTTNVDSEPAQDVSTAAVSSVPASDASTPAVNSVPAADATLPAEDSAAVPDTSTPAVNAGSEAQPAAAVADATDLTQQLTTPDPLANGSASAGPSSASTVGNLAEQPVAGIITYAVSQDISASVKDFTQAFNFVESGVVKLGTAAKDELIALARKYL